MYTMYEGFDVQSGLDLCCIRHFIDFPYHVLFLLQRTNRGLEGEDSTGGIRGVTREEPTIGERERTQQVFPVCVI